MELVSKATVKRWLNSIGVYGYENKVDALPAIKAKSEWTPCSERLPKEPFGCLVTVWDEDLMSGEMFENILPYFVGWDGEQWNDSDGMQCPFEVIAWMQLPKPWQRR